MKGVLLLALYIIQNDLFFVKTKYYLFWLQLCTDLIIS